MQGIMLGSLLSVQDRVLLEGYHVNIVIVSTLVMGVDNCK